MELLVINSDRKTPLPRSYSWHHIKINKGNKKHIKKPLSLMKEKTNYKPKSQTMTRRLKNQTSISEEQPGCSANLGQVGRGQGSPKRMCDRTLKCSCSLPGTSARQETWGLPSWKKELPAGTQGWRASSFGAVGLGWPKTDLKAKPNKTPKRTGSEMTQGEQLPGKIQAPGYHTFQWGTPTSPLSNTHTSFQK